MKYRTVMNTKRTSFILDINNYYANGNVCIPSLIKDMKAYAKPVKDIKYTDLIDVWNGVYAFLYNNTIIYIGKCSSRSFSERFAGHISTKPTGYMNNVMKNIAWCCSPNNLSKRDFLADNNEPDRTRCLKNAIKIMKVLRIVCVSFDTFTSSKKKENIDQFEGDLINTINPLFNGIKRSAQSQISLRKNWNNIYP